MPMQSEKRDIQIDDVAAALGLSKSTISRAISGKGRIGEDTRKRVLDYIERHGYRPSSIAKSLAQSCTYNVGVVLPLDSFSSEVPFFQSAMIGVSQAAQEVDYDVIVITASEADISALRRLIVNKKVDGIVLTRSVENDPCISFLQQAGIPFVLIGRSDDPSVVQVDADNAAACRALTRSILSRGRRSPAYLYGSSEHTVNRSRLTGFLMGVTDAGLLKSSCRIVPDMSGRQEISAEVDALIQGDTDCIFCGDDYICSRVLWRLTELGAYAPDRMPVASFFDSVLLESFRPVIPSVEIDARALGAAAADLLLRELAGKAVFSADATPQNTYIIKDS